MDEAFLSFKLEGVVREQNGQADFEGPLSLILMLLQKNKIEIRDIKIADILDQYLEYLNEMQKMDLEVASEFVRMAAYLLYIKTKTLLSGTDDEVSELELLMQSLEALQAKDVLAAVKSVSDELGEAYKKYSLIISKPPEPLPKCAGEYQFTHQPVELLSALHDLLSAGTEKPAVDLTQIRKAIPHVEIYSVRSKSRQILERLRQRDIALDELYSECSSRSEVVATFVAVLELCSVGSISVSVLPSGKGYKLSFAGGEINDILELIEE